jgi:cell division septal protein FtsQ
MRSNKFRFYLVSLSMALVVCLTAWELYYAMSFLSLKNRNVITGNITSDEEIILSNRKYYHSPLVLWLRKNWYPAEY